MELIGKTAEVRLRVPAGRSEDRSPSSHQVVELMELAAARLVQASLEPGESSQAIELDLTFLKPVPPNAMVRAVATCRGVSGRLCYFSIHAFDERGLVASCEHTRAIVSSRRILARSRLGAGEPVAPLPA